MVEKSKLSLSIRVWGWIAALGCLPFMAYHIHYRHVTILLFGPRTPIGFSISIWFFVICAPLLFLWLVTVIGLCIRDWVDKRPIGFRRYFSIIAAAIIFASIPQPQALFVAPRLGIYFLDRIRSRHRVKDVDSLLSNSAAGDLDRVKSLLAHGVPINFRDLEGNTALHAAAGSGDLKMIAYLISNGADVNAINSHGQSPLDIAAIKQHSEAAKIISDHGGVKISSYTITVKP